MSPPLKLLGYYIELYTSCNHIHLTHQVISRDPSLGSLFLHSAPDGCQAGAVRGGRAERDKNDKLSQSSGSPYTHICTHTHIDMHSP